MAKSLVEKVFIDGHLVVRGGTFFCRTITMFAPIEDADNADKIIGGDDIKDGTFETYENYGSPYIDYYVKGAITMVGGTIIMNTDIKSDFIVQKQLNEISNLLNTAIPNPDLHQLFFREQFAMTMSVLETFLYSLVLRELIFNKKKLLDNIRTFTYGDDFLKIGKHIGKTDDELFLIIEEKATKIVYHNFDKVVLLYKIVFRKDITSYVNSIAPELGKRHNIVHRNGQKLNGEVEPISKSEVENFIDKVENITQSIWDLIKSE